MTNGSAEMNLIDNTNEVLSLLESHDRLFDHAEWSRDYASSNIASHSVRYLHTKDDLDMLMYLIEWYEEMLVDSRDTLATAKDLMQIADGIALA